MFNGKLVRQVPTQGLHAIALGRMVSGGEIMDSVLARNVDGRLGYLATDKSVQTEPGGSFQV